MKLRVHASRPRYTPTASSASPPAPTRTRPPVWASTRAVTSRDWVLLFAVAEPLAPMTSWAVLTLNTA